MNRRRKHVFLAAIPIALIALIIGVRANFFLLPLATIDENGHAVRGYVYANTYRPKQVTHLIITHSESGKRHSYLVSIRGPIVFDCEDWIAPRLPLFVLPDVNPPCVRIYLAEEVPRLPKVLDRDINVRVRTFEFTANDGKRLTLKW